LVEANERLATDRSLRLVTDLPAALSELSGDEPVAVDDFFEQGQQP
jgi:hypothetical protein